MRVVAFKFLNVPSSSVHIYKVFFTTDTLPNYRSAYDGQAETYFSLPCMKMVHEFV